MDFLQCLGSMVQFLFQGPRRSAELHSTSCCQSEACTELYVTPLSPDALKKVIQHPLPTPGLRNPTIKDPGSFYIIGKL